LLFEKTFVPMALQIGRLSANSVRHFGELNSANLASPFGEKTSATALPRNRRPATRAFNRFFGHRGRSNAASPAVTTQRGWVLGGHIGPTRACGCEAFAVALIPFSIGG
jgi:hypothetical protein